MPQSTSRRPPMPGVTVPRVISAACLLTAILLTPPAAHAKDGPSYYTPEKVEAIRYNIERYDWAKEMRDEAVEEADYIIEHYGGLEGLWSMITSQSIPRTDHVNNKKGSPFSGKKIYEGRGFHPWRSKIDHPWKVLDPESGKMLPSNDFEAYYKSGLNEHHEFDPDLADKSLLVNEMYPDKGKKWGVDDGYGWIDEDGDRRAFIGYYNQWHNWWRGVYTFLPVLRDAYLYSGDVKYARAGLVILDRIADVYPEMNISDYPYEYSLISNHGGVGTGKVLGCIGACRPARRMCEAYDAFYPAADDPELIAFLSEKAKKYDLGDKASARAIRQNIEQNIVKQILPAVKKMQISGNFGWLQGALGMAAVVADEPEGYTTRALDFMFQAGKKYRNEKPRRITGGNVVPHLINVIDRNGHNDDVSPNYNTIPLENLSVVAEILADYEGYSGYRGFSFRDSVKWKAMHSGRIPLLMIGKYFPHIGDAGGTGNPGMEADDVLEPMVRAFGVWGDEDFAVAAYIINGGTTEGIHGPLTSQDPAELPRRIQKIVDKRGTDLPPQNEAGYGFSALRDGKGEQGRAAWMYYGRTEGSHAHHDALNLGYFGFDLDLLPDLGYPTRTGRWPSRFNWTKATISHNTVTVDAEQQQIQIAGRPHHFEGDNDLVQLTDVAAPKVYPDLDLYRRLTSMIRVDEKNSYLVDFFRVRGGKDHVFSFHSADGEVETEKLSLSPQDGGTYAGPDIPMPEYGKNTPYNKKGGWPNEGFNYLHDVSRDQNPPDHFAVDWRIRDTYGVVTDKGEMTDTHLRYTALGDVDEAALAKGNPPLRGDNPKSIPYLLLRRKGENLNSTFTSVIEPYRQQRLIRSIEALPVDGPEDAMARAVKVTLKDGRTDYIASTLDGRATYKVDGRLQFTGQFAFVRVDSEGRPIRANLVDGTELIHRPEDGEPRQLIDAERGRLTGEVVSFKKGLTFENRMTVTLPGASSEDVTGRWIFVETDGQPNGAYEILDAEPRGDNLILHLGEITLVREMKDPENLEAGFVYNIKPGAACTVPLSTNWQKGE